MHPTLSHCGVLAFDPIAPRDVSVVLEHARALQLAAEAGGLRTLLRGRKLGLLCEVDTDARTNADTTADTDIGTDIEGDAALFRRAALELGAHVARIRPSLNGLSTPREVQHTASMLGRLYDAVECQGMAAALVHQMGVDAGVPVYDGVASNRHPTARLVDLLDGDASTLDKRRFVLQAVLLSTIA